MTGSPLIVGHRGASARAPENTLAAFQLAIDVGADGIEFDVQLAKDGVPVVIHDHTLERTGLRPDAIADLTSSELSEMSVGSWFNAKFPHLANHGFESETVPTLAQVLELLTGFDGLIFVELKCGGRDFAPLVAAVCDIIRHSPLLPRMIVKSFDLAAIPEVRQRLPEVQTAALFEPKVIDFLRGRKRILAAARDFGATQLSLHYSLVTRKLVSMAAEAEMPVAIWTVDEIKWIERSRDLGVRAIITNDPAKLLAHRASLR